MREHIYAGGVQWGERMGGRRGWWPDHQGGAKIQGSLGMLMGRRGARRVGHQKAESIETLFRLYDMLEAHCQETAKAGRTASGKDAAAAAQLLDELRQRFVRLVRAVPPVTAPNWASLPCMNRDASG